MVTSTDPARVPVARKGSQRAAAAMFVLLTALGAGATATGCGGDPQPISVLTRNLFLGADLTPLFMALDVAQLSAASGRVWGEIVASAFEERAGQLATEIAINDPDVVALQEVSLFRTQTPGDWQSGAAPNATHVDFDFLQILLQALAARSAHYQFAVMGDFTDEEVPARTADGVSFDVRLTDRNVILVRDGLTFAAGPSAAFAAAFRAPAGGFEGTTITLQRGYVSTDVTVGSKTARVVNTHLEVGGLLTRTQEEQARELTMALAATGGAVILAGDFNSPADNTGSMSYGLLTTDSGSSKRFLDVWEFRNRNSPPQEPISLPNGNTCCLDLRDAVLAPNQRIDLVLFRGGIQPVDAIVVEPSRTMTGLWPSDHLGVYAELLIP